VTFGRNNKHEVFKKAVGVGKGSKDVGTVQEFALERMEYF
jgi:hypothetical protein